MKKIITLCCYFLIASTSYSNIEGGLTGTGNIDLAPLFTAAASGDYTLQENSPCIDAGDPNGALDSDGTRKDLGYQAVDQDLLSDTRSL
ncbi:MAG: hypothetical protein R6U84_06920, partial [Candidatus Cloacimonadales bacterium]